MHENQAVMYTVQDQDDYVMSEDDCHDLLYEKLYYCITHQNNKVAAREYQYHINALPKSVRGLRLVT